MNNIELRDYLAGQAITATVQASIMNEEVARALYETAKDEGISEDRLLARGAYQLADAMLEERNA